MSTPPFYLKSFLFLLQFMQRFEIIEKHNSLISKGLSESYCKNSIKLSMTPSSVIFILYYSSNKEALLNTFKHFSLLSGSVVLVKNLVKQYNPFFSAKLFLKFFIYMFKFFINNFWFYSSFMYTITLVKMLRQCNYISLN